MIKKSKKNKQNKAVTTSFIEISRKYLKNNYFLKNRQFEFKATNYFNQNLDHVR